MQILDSLKVRWIMTSNAALPLVIVLLASGIGSAQLITSNNSTYAWTEDFTGGGKNETLSIEGKTVYLYNGGSQPSMIIGNINGYTINPGDIYVGNLDGNSLGRKTIAFFDSVQRGWFWGVITDTTLTWLPVGESVNGTAVFHVGNGPVISPADQMVATEVAKTAVRSDATSTLTPIVYPVEGDQYNALSPSQHVWTHFRLNSNGSVEATTEVKEDTLLGGFHAGVSVCVYTTKTGNPPIPAWCVPIPKPLGATGTLFGASKITWSWQGQIPQDRLAGLQYYAIDQQWAPDWYATISNLNKFAQLLAPIIKLFEK
jgi:hypothetical protein